VFNTAQCEGLPEEIAVAAPPPPPGMIEPQVEALIRTTLFQPPLDERKLLLINLAQDNCLREIALDLRGVSAHARLAAMMG